MCLFIERSLGNGLGEEIEAGGPVGRGCDMEERNGGQGMNQAVVVEWKGEM